MKYKEVANFVIVYVKEAHPETNGKWRITKTRASFIRSRRPSTSAESLHERSSNQMDVETETLLDDIENTAMACYAAWPERFYVIDTSGRIVYKGGIGPFYFDPDEVDEVLREQFAKGPT